LWQLVRREIIGRYRGSTLGLLWSFFNPILMLAVYTFVFSVVFNMRWGLDTQETKGAFALVLFVGIILHSLLAECLNKAPLLMTGNINYVKRVVFPLELLPVVTLMSALFHAAISFIVLLVAMLILQASFHWTILLTPIVILPLVLLSLGLTWGLAAFGVYFRDIGHVMGMLTMVLMFLAPIFYPLSMIPDAFQPFMFLNPLTLMVEQTRQVVIMGAMPNWIAWFAYLIISLIVLWGGFAAFQKARKGFADVL
jgi:lipopolysaccharide transport system permease protein